MLFVYQHDQLVFRMKRLLFSAITWNNYIPLFLMGFDSYYISRETYSIQVALNSLWRVMHESFSNSLQQD